MNSMEHIPGYEEWKTSAPEEPAVITKCDMCGAELYTGDSLFTVNGERLCEDCLNDMYREVL